MTNDDDRPAAQTKPKRKRRDKRKRKRIALSDKYLVRKLSDMAKVENIAEARLAANLIRLGISSSKRGAAPPTTPEVDARATRSTPPETAMLDLIFPTFVPDCCCGGRH